jgi:hypothetical protein
MTWLIAMARNQATDRLHSRKQTSGKASEIEALLDMIADDKRMHPIATLGGCTLMAGYDMRLVKLTDENGTTASVTIADVLKSNDAIHVIDPRCNDKIHAARCKVLFIVTRLTKPRTWLT